MNLTALIRLDWSCLLPCQSPLCNQTDAAWKFDRRTVAGQDMNNKTQISSHQQTLKITRRDSIISSKLVVPKTVGWVLHCKQIYQLIVGALIGVKLNMTGGVW